DDGNTTALDGCDATCLSECAAGSQTFNFTGAIETFVVPTGCSRITITAQGAQGGGMGGLGASMTGTFTLTAGDSLSVLVGEEGLTEAPGSYGHSGGGGSFVVDAAGTLLLAAGGGGAGDHNMTGLGGPGLTTEAGGASGDGVILGGTGGNGGQGSASLSCGCGGAGGGGG
ncbi:MAG TPA: hypothetical protein DEF51_25445, partial [Myxococcales bacterium]|nr:hypothetical protein [Myxococcales bacterium]